MSYEKLIELYENNSRFMEYVDKYCWTYNLTLKVALTHKIVKSTAQYIVNGQ